MELEEVVDKLKELGDLPSYSSSDKSEIERLYKEVLGKEFTKTSCNDCYRDAVIEMTVYIKKNNRMKEKCNYILKNGVLLQPEFGSNKMYTNDNLTDEVAEKYLAKIQKVKFISPIYLRTGKNVLTNVDTIKACLIQW